jgi:hypothetical protein
MDASQASYAGSIPVSRSTSFGAVAQLGERLHGMQEVRGSNPLSSTRVSTTAGDSKGSLATFSEG